MDAVAAGPGADIDDRIADARSGRVENLVGIGEADGHRVDQDVAVIGVVEIDLAAEGRDADAIAVDADAVNDPGDEVPHLRMIGPAAAQRVNVGDRSRATGEYGEQNCARDVTRPQGRLHV